jgi:hypothetical protein
MPTRVPAHVYVYYRIAADNAAARDAVAALFASVADATGVVGRLLARCDNGATWIEIYEPVDDADAFVRQLAVLVTTHRVARLAVAGERHIECFAPLAPLHSGAERRGMVPPPAR